MCSQHIRFRNVDRGNGTLLATIGTPRRIRIRRISHRNPPTRMHVGHDTERGVYRPRARIGREQRKGQWSPPNSVLAPEMLDKAGAARFPWFQNTRPPCTSRHGLENRRTRPRFAPMTPLSD